MSDADDPQRQAPPRRIGLLFVHGIGEQKRFDHLRETAADLAELMLQANPGATMTTLDRTADWPFPAGVVDPAGTVPLTMTLQVGSSRTIFSCREAWWADLGARSGLSDTIAFWLWALGQWATPIYRLLDITNSSNKPGDAPITQLPKSVVGTRHEFYARIMLALVALCALMVSLSWVLAKRVFSKLAGQAPSPTLIVQYVGDVHTYEARAAPGNTNLSDPGYPRRVAIRRRMVTEMVAMATGNLDGWHIVAHSLGTIVAYNALTELGHTLPNYLPQDQWRQLPYLFRHDDNCHLRPHNEIAEMMPARPDWLGPDDVINRQLVFAKLRGVLTYGSPLDKFATLWPRIVATAIDRKDGTSPFPADCTWINYYAPADPVGAHLDYYDDLADANAVPKVENRRAPPGFQVGWAHILYLDGIECFQDRFVDEQKRAVARWLSGENPPRICTYVAPIKTRGHLRETIVPFMYGVVVVVLWVLSAAMVTAVGGTVKAVLTTGSAKFASLGKFIKAMAWVMPDLIGYLLTMVLMMGLLRWYRESRLNRKLLASARCNPNTRQSAATDAQTATVAGVVTQQERIGRAWLIIGGVVVSCGLLADLGYLHLWSPHRSWCSHLSGLVVATIAIAIAAATQTAVNSPTTAIGMPESKPVP